MEREIRERIDKLLEKMTLREKIGQLNQEALQGNNIAALKEKICRGEVGSILLADSATAGNDGGAGLEVSAVNELIRCAREESRLKIPVIFGRDVIHGHKTVLPVPLALAATFDEELVERGYEMVAAEAAADGVEWGYSPVLDIARDPRWGRCVEGLGEDPYLASHLGAAMVRGFKKGGLEPCSKHYIGYGASEGGRDYNNSEITGYTLRNIYLPPFKAAVEGGLLTVMNSFNGIGGEAASSSRYLLRNILKEELGFEGFVVSDWGAVEQMTEQGIAADRKNAAEIALNAGVDMDMAEHSYLENLEQLVSEGKVLGRDIDDAVSRILYVKFKAGLFEKEKVRESEWDTAAHGTVAEECSDRAMVLLKNEGNILPISEQTRVMVAGPLAFEKRGLLGTWTLDADVSGVWCIADALCAALPGARVPESRYMWDDCLCELARVDAVILVLGESYRVTGEANSLCDISLPREQLEFVKRVKSAGKPVIGVLCFARPIALGDAEKYFDAILYAWHSGTKTAESAAKIISGRLNPSGRLPMSMPRATGQIPIYYNANKTGRRRTSYYGEENVWVYSYQDMPSTPLYPFGYGLSYTEFSYSDIKIEKNEITRDELLGGNKIKVSIDVKNTGNFPGTETVQCYINNVAPGYARPVRELKGICRLRLEPGEKKTAEFYLGAEELSFFAGDGTRITAAGEYEVYVGPSCYAKNTVKFRVTQ